MSSLETAITILQCFSTDEPELAVSDVAKRVGVPKSTVSRLMKAMANGGLIDQTESRRYRVGMLPFHLGQLYKAHVRVLEMVETAVDELVEDAGFTGYVGVLNGGDVVILRMHPGDYPVRIVLEPGYRVPAFATALGKALLARFSNRDLRHRLPSVLVNDHTGLRKPIAEFLAELDALREQPWTTVREETFLGTGAIGTAVGSADQQQPLGFSLSFPTNAVTVQHEQEMVDQLVAAAARIAAKTGDPVWKNWLDRAAYPRKRLRAGGHPWATV